jgi:hypothetical protein
MSIDAADEGLFILIKSTFPLGGVPIQNMVVVEEAMAVGCDRCPLFVFFGARHIDTPWNRSCWLCADIVVLNRHSNKQT